MADISAKDVMSLRNRTGLSMMACKKALVEAGGDVEKGEEILRKQQKGKMEKRADRAAGEGRIAIAVNGSSASIIELKAETDFTAKNEQFGEVANKLAQLTLAADDGQVSATPEMAEIVDDIKIKTGENISLGRARKVAGDAKTTFGSYVHHDGKTGVLLVAEGDVPEDVRRQICMHITAAVPRPMGVSADDIPADVVEKERQFRISQAVESGKPQEIAEKMVEGGMRKFFAEIALLEQDFVMDPSKKIKDLLGGATVKSFYRWEVGEAAG